MNREKKLTLARTICYYDNFLFYCHWIRFNSFKLFSCNFVSDIFKRCKGRYIVTKCINYYFSTTKAKGDIQSPGQDFLKMNFQILQWFQSFSKWNFLDDFDTFRWPWLFLDCGNLIFIHHLIYLLLKNFLKILLT